MKKEKIKEFVQEHKKQLCIGAGIVIGGVSMYLLGRSSVKMSDSYGQRVIDAVCKNDDAKRFVEFVKTCDEVKNGASHYIPFDAAEFAKLTGKEMLVDGNGVLCKVTGGIAFANPVGTITEF